MEFASRLSAMGYDDALILRPEIAREVMTEKRLELIEEIAEGEAESIRDLAKKVGRDKSAVYKDLQVLYEHQVIAFKEDGNRKVPVMKHDHIFPMPVTA